VFAVNASTLVEHTTIESKMNRSAIFNADRKLLKNLGFEAASFFWFFGNGIGAFVV
jgi:hypothetical protein